MVKSDLAIENLLAENPVILLRENRKLRNAIQRATEAGTLTRLLPGVYLDAGRSDDLATRVSAVGRWDPCAVICGRAAAALTYWPEIEVGTIEVCSKVRHAPQPGFSFTEREIPPELVQDCGDIAMTVPSLTAIELATFDFTDPIDIALRKRQVSLAGLQYALDLTPHRRGHADRRQVLLDSRDEPWSAAERLAQRIYRRAGITGWMSNLRTVIPGRGTYYLDIAFRQERVASEIDGRIHQTDASLFESDRTRQNALLLDGWLLLRFTWRMLDNEPEYVVATTREALAVRRTNAGVSGLWTPDTRGLVG